MTINDITLIRHGQANTGARDEKSYDMLSKTGHQQAKWLGEYLRTNGDIFDRIICGSLRRHQETVTGLNLPHDLQIDPRVNEMRYFDLAEEFHLHTGTPVPESPAEFATHLPQVFNAWHLGKLDCAHESYIAFAQRFADVMRELKALGGRSLVVTSGGVIGMAIVQHLALGPDGFARVMLPIFNSSMHRFQICDNETHLVSYNGTPHLDMTDRLHARTTI